jgi:hypothetical protein
MGQLRTRAVRQNVRSLDHLVGMQQHCCRQFEADRLDRRIAKSASSEQGAGPVPFPCGGNPCASAFAMTELPVDWFELVARLIGSINCETADAWKLRELMSDGVTPVVGKVQRPDGAVT